MQAASAEIYQAAQQQAQAGAQAGTGDAPSSEVPSGNGRSKKDEEGPVIDAEVVEEKKD
jgi:hypothetical protein